MPKMEWCIINKETNDLLLLNHKDDSFAIIFDNEKQAYDFMDKVKMPAGSAEVCQKIIFGSKLGYCDAMQILKKEN